MWSSRSLSIQICSLARVSPQKLEQTRTITFSSGTPGAQFLTRSKPRRSASQPWQYSRWQSTNSDGGMRSTSKGDLQAENSKPHKEYFQTPGQAPEPDFTPYVRTSQSQSSTAFVPPPPSYLQQHPGTQAQQGSDGEHKTYSNKSKSSRPRSDSLGSRLTRSFVYIIVFYTLGTLSGQALITWEYISPLFEEGSEEEAEILEEITDTLEDHNLIFELREDGWKEVDLTSPNMVSASQNVKSLAGDLSITPGSVGVRDRSSPISTDTPTKHVQGQAEGVGMGRSMLYQMLGGSKGVIGLKMFHHPSQDYSIMVFFTGFGIESLPDLVHGGMVTTLLEEAVQKHIDWFHRGQFEHIVDVGVKLEFDNEKPVKPGEIYAVLVPPALVEPVKDHSNLGFTHGLRSGMNKMKMVGLLMQLDGAPKINSASTKQGGVSVEHYIEVPGRGRNGPAIHATGEITLKVLAGRNSEQQQQQLLDSIAKGNASFSSNHNRTEDDSEE